MNTLHATIPTRRVRANHVTTQSHACGHCVVTQAVLIRLRSSPYYALQSLTCEFQLGQLSIDGNVRTYFMKQMAQETTRAVNGVEVVVNRVIVLKYD